MSNNRTKYEDGEMHGRGPIQLSNKAWRNIPANEYNTDSEHPTPEQLLIRQAVKFLTPKQKIVWELSNYDKLTQDDIAVKLSISQAAVSKHLSAIEKRIAKWVKSNMGAYNLLKSDLGEQE